MNELRTFNNDEFGEVRTVQLNNETYFVGKDVAEALGYSNTRDALAKHVEAEDKADVAIHDGSQNRTMTTINESGLYALIFGSKLESAKRFKHWVTSEVLPSLRKTGHYEMPKPKKVRIESLSAANTTVKTLTPILEAAGCNSQIVLLTAKAIYEKAGLALPIEIKADQQYYDTVHIARKVGIYYQSSGKPADKAVNEIIRRLNIPADMYTETWESKGQWQGTVRKYAAPVIGMVEKWYADNGYPSKIEYEQTNGQKKSYHVIWRKSEVA